MDSWAVYSGDSTGNKPALILNFRPSIKENFLKNPDYNIKQADARWATLWGGLRTGPFNTECLAETWNQRPCTKYPQHVPGITPDSPSPSPSPPPAPPSGDCLAAVHKECPNTSGTECEQCCRTHHTVVRPACKTWDEVIAACGA